MHKVWGLLEEQNKVKKLILGIKSILQNDLISSGPLILGFKIKHSKVSPFTSNKYHRCSMKEC